MTSTRAPAAALAGAMDTIVAIATPPGRGALSLIRVSGPRAHEIGAAICSRWPRQPRQAALTAVRDGQRNVLDEAVVVRYDAPASFTGEDSFELSTHGGFVVPATVVAAIIESGARLAIAGEFTRRALQIGRAHV